MATPRVDENDGTPFRLLGDIAAVDDDQLRTLYAYPTGLPRCWVRGNAISSADGGATTDGTSGGLGNAGDRRLFQLLRELADVIVVGAGTVRAEHYAGAQMTVRQRQQRQARGQAEIPPLAVVTHSGQLDRDLAALTHTEVPPLVLTCSAAVAAANAHLGTRAHVIDCSGADPGNVDPEVILAMLAERRMTRVLTEGGPTLMSTLITHDLLDDLCLTIAPVLVGGEAIRIASGSGHAERKMRRAHLISDADGYLYARYARAS